MVVGNESRFLCEIKYSRDLRIIWKTLAVAFADSDSILRRYLNESM